MAIFQFRLVDLLYKAMSGLMYYCLDVLSHCTGYYIADKDNILPCSNLVLMMSCHISFMYCSDYARIFHMIVDAFRIRKKQITFI